MDNALTLCYCELPYFAMLHEAEQNAHRRFSLGTFYSLADKIFGHPSSFSLLDILFSFSPIFRNDQASAMNFGFSIGDFIGVGQLAWQVYRKSKKAPSEFKTISSQLISLHIHGVFA